MLKVLKVRESIETVINSIFVKIIVKVRLYFFSFQLSVPNNIGYELNRSNKTVLHCLIWLFDKINRIGKCYCPGQNFGPLNNPILSVFSLNGPK